ncbi:MAG: hypothetical protein GX454_04115 [Brooklawnia sp.]|nr:hypothetical protein [Brooklawnia sp.]
MNSMWGMDLEQGELLAKQFSSQAGRLESIQRQVGLLMLATGWLGSDWDFFCDDWGRRLSPQMTRAVAALRDASSVLATQVAQQRAASSADGDTGANIGFKEWLALEVDTLKEGFDSAGELIWEEINRHPLVRVHRENFERIHAAGTALGRFLDSVDDAAKRNLEILASGRVPTISELLAQGVISLGLLASVPINYTFGKDFRFGDDGAVGSFTSRQMTYQPINSFTDLTNLTMESYSENGITITKVAEDQWVVSIAGTQGEVSDFRSYTGTARPNDWQANLHTFAYGQSTYGNAIKQLIETHIPPGDRVLLQGHSQGGDQAASLAADPAIFRNYRIDGVVAYGAPIDCINVPRNIPVLSIEIVGDPVVELDLGGRDILLQPAERSNVVTLQLESKLGALPFDNHKTDAYMEAMAKLNPEQAQLLQNFAERANLDSYYGQHDDGQSKYSYTPQRK